MTEPSVTFSAFVAVAMATLAPGVPVNVVLGAFAGALLFVATSNDFGLGKKIVLFVPSFIAGFLLADITTRTIDLLSGLTDIDPAVGALLSSAAAVRILLAAFKWLDDPQLPFSGRRPRAADDDPHGGPYS